MSRSILLPIALAALLGGCAAYERLYQPAEYTPVTEMKPGPGLFTGESGVVRLCCGGDALVGGSDIGAAGNGPGRHDGEVVPGNPGEPVVVKRRRDDRE